MTSKEKRIEFHNKLIQLTGINNVYFQPPENLQMNYPAIVYSRYNINDVSADDDKYLQGTIYRVTVIDKNPDSELVYKVSNFPTARYERHFNTSGLNHDVFIINFK